MVAGGDIGNYRYTTSIEIIGSKTSSVPLIPNLPVPLGSHCMAQMDSLTLAITGGYTTAGYSDCTRKSYFLNLASKIWTEGPAMIAARGEHGCSFIAGRDGKPTAIVAGGHVQPSPSRMDSVEIYNRALNKWESGTSLPQKINAFQVIDQNILLVNTKLLHLPFYCPRLCCTTTC